MDRASARSFEFALIFSPSLPMLPYFVTTFLWQLSCGHCGEPAQASIAATVATACIKSLCLFVLASLHGQSIMNYSAIFISV